MRSMEEQKQSQLKRLVEFHAAHANESPAMLVRLQQAVIDNRNVFEVLMEAGLFAAADYERVVGGGGQHRRSM